MNYQLLGKAPINYQLDQNKAFNYQRQPFSPIPSVRWVITNGQRVTWLSYAVLLSFSSYFLLMNYHHLPTCPHVKQHITFTYVTRWPFVLTPITDGRMKKGLTLVVECYFGRIGSLWGLCAKIDKKKYNYSKLLL
jgi:hypothetical protein